MTARLTRSNGIGPGCLRPLQMIVDGKPAGPIESGETRTLTLPPGTHTLRVKQDFLSSEELTLRLEDGAIQALQCGCFVEGPIFLLFVVWLWRTLVPGKLFYLRRSASRPAGC